MRRRGQPLFLSAIVAALLWGGPSQASATPHRGFRAAAPAAPSVKLPDTKAAQRLTELLRTINGGGEAALRAEAMSAFEGADRDPHLAAARSSDLYRILRKTGGLDLRQITTSTSARIEVLVESKRTHAWYRVSLFTTAAPPDYVTAAPPHKIVGFGFDSVTAPANLGRCGLSDPAIARELDRMVGFLARGDQFSGVVRLQRGQRVVYSKAFGEADLASNSANTLQTRFNLASITKMFTAVAVGQLVEAGKVRLSDRVGKVLPELADTDLGRQATVDQLLSHTAGLAGARQAIDAGLEPGPEAHSIKEMTAKFARAPLASRPGQQFQYSNLGYILLGAMIERASGETYYDYVRRHIFEPAGMRSSVFLESDNRPARVAIGYKDAPDGKRTPNTTDLPSVATPANMAFSTAGDMGRFARELLGGTLLSRNLLSQFWTGVTEQRNEAQYGYGAWIERYRGTRIVWHGGGAPGVTNRFEIYPDQDASLVVLSNYDSEPEVIANKVREWLTPCGAPSEADPSPVLTINAKLSGEPAHAGSGVSVDLTVNNSGGTAHAAIVDFEVKDETGGKVDQQFVSGQRLSGSKSRTFRFVWTPKTKGHFRIDTGIFGPDWSGKLKFAEGIATVEVK
jgi:CubicO group peptidase (beta-lactamase class C family)